MTTPPTRAAMPDVVEIERALNRVSQLMTRVRQHDRLMAMAGVSLDRAGVSLLRQLLGAGPVRLGELAVRLGVEASHVTRQVQALERSGHVSRVPDPDDRRAQLIELTEAGRNAVESVRAASVSGMQLALEDWTAKDLRQLAGLLNRMVDDFLGFTLDEDAPTTS